MGIFNQLAELKSSLESIVAQANVERGARFFEQIESEYPAFAAIFKDFVFKPAPEACATITKFTGVKFDAKGIAFVERLQAKLKEKRFPR